MSSCVIVFTIYVVNHQRVRCPAIRQTPHELVSFGSAFELPRRRAKATVLAAAAVAAVRPSSPRPHSTSAGRGGGRSREQTGLGPAKRSHPRASPAATAPARSAAERGGGQQAHAAGGFMNTCMGRRGQIGHDRGRCHFLEILLNSAIGRFRASAQEQSSPSAETCEWLRPLGGWQVYRRLGSGAEQEGNPI